jgi:hypothetical protein
MSVSTESLKGMLEAPLAAAAAVDPADPGAARAALHRAYPPEGEAAGELREALIAAMEQGLVCDRGTDALRYSRLLKADATPHGLSVDVVWMTGPGPEHRHPNGELNLCFAVEGSARFDGQPEGWVVFPPGSRHVPTVTDGRMLIAYFLPQGAIEFSPPPDRD